MSRIRRFVEAMYTWHCKTFPWLSMTFQCRLLYFGVCLSHLPKSLFFYLPFIAIRIDFDWDFWVTNNSSDSSEDAVLWSKNLVHILGCRLDLHKIVRSDQPNVFHSHPANAIRVVLWNGYCEEILEKVCCTGVEGIEVDEFCCGRPKAKQSLVFRLPGHVGLVRPGFIHRINNLFDGSSYSLWFRGRVRHPIEMYTIGRLGIIRKYAEKQEAV